jgi:hypothetical protein
MADDKKDLLRKIIERLDAIEYELLRKVGSDEVDSLGNAQCCGLPLMPTRELEAGIDPNRESLIRSIEKKWVNGTELKYYFFNGGDWGGSDSQQKIVKEAFEEWKDIGIGLSFKPVNSASQADIRIGFMRGDGAWSYVGRDIWGIPVNERTMNFGWTLSGQDGRDTALHEIGHTLGFHHEQQNPFAGIEWNVEAVYRYFTGPPNNWSRQKTFNNVLRTLEPNSVEGSEWDPDSIMQYAIRSGLILRPEAYRNGLNPAAGLSDIDKARVRLFYPKTDRDLAELKPFQSESLSLAPAAQANFVINPESTRQYQIQTFGSTDTVIVLFEENQGTLEHFAADDDSGWNRNASLNVRLVRGRRYILRIRLYYSQNAGETAVMLW